jgi:hypothetical protein
MYVQQSQPFSLYNLFNDIIKVHVYVPPSHVSSFTALTYEILSEIVSVDHGRPREKPEEETEGRKHLQECAIKKSL